MSERGESVRVFKQVKAGVKSADELSAREYGLLYLYYPFMLPDVDEERRAELLEERGAFDE